MLVSKTELEKRRKALGKSGGYKFPDSQSPWQQYFREKVEPFADGMVLKDAPNYRDIAAKGTPRNNH